MQEGDARQRLTRRSAGAAPASRARGARNRDSRVRRAAGEACCVGCVIYARAGRRGRSARRIRFGIGRSDCGVGGCAVHFCMRRSRGRRRLGGVRGGVCRGHCSIGWRRRLRRDSGRSCGRRGHARRSERCRSSRCRSSRGRRGGAWCCGGSGRRERPDRRSFRCPRQGGHGRGGRRRGSGLRRRLRFRATRQSGNQQHKHQDARQNREHDLGTDLIHLRFPRPHYACGLF